MVEILGINAIVLAVGITVLGLVLRITLGITKNKTKLDFSHIFQSLVIGFFASLPIVATALHNIPKEIQDLHLFVMLIGMLGTVVGIDAGVKGAKKAIQEVRSPPYDS